MKSILISALFLPMLVACAYPAQKLTIPEDRPAIWVQGAPEGAILLVDNVNMGEAAQYDGKKKALLVERGTHQVMVTLGEQQLYSEEVYLGGGETRALRLSGGN